MKIQSEKIQIDGKTVVVVNAHAYLRKSGNGEKGLAEQIREIPFPVVECRQPGQWERLFPFYPFNLDSATLAEMDRCAVSWPKAGNADLSAENECHRLAMVRADENFNA